MLNYVSFGVSVLIAGVAAYFSIIGLATIFAGQYLSVIVMATVLEIGKLVTATWLHVYWNDVRLAYKAYLLSAVVSLMLITSMGIFGYLSKAHFEQMTEQETIQMNVDKIQFKIDSQQELLTDIQSEIDILNSAMNKYVELGYVTKGLEQRETQSVKRDSLLKQKTSINDKILVYKQDQMLYNRQMVAFESEIGPMKYVGKLIYGEVEDITTKAVTLVILFLMFSFDPLAVILLIVSANKIILSDSESVEPIVKSDQIFNMD